MRFLAFSSLCSIVSTIACAGPLVINEVDYDNIGADTTEFVEIKNTSGAYVPLAGVDLVFINGANNAEYLRVDLTPAGGLFPGHYLVVADLALIGSIAPGATVLQFSLSQNNIQNGSPDGIAIVDTNTQTLIDTFCYEGAMTAAVITGLGAVNLVQGTPLGASTADSNTIQTGFSRLPDGATTGNDIADWALAYPTPGAMNSCAFPVCHINPGSFAVLPGGTATFYAAFNAYRPDLDPLTFAWRRNGAPVNLLDPRISVTNSLFASTLTIQNVGAGDTESAATGYECKVSHGCGATASTRAALTLSNPCPADLNNDNQVDDDDFVLFATAYDILDCADPNMPTDCPADLSGDGFVDDTDFVLFAAAYDVLLCP